MAKQVNIDKTFVTVVKHGNNYIDVSCHQEHPFFIIFINITTTTTTIILLHRLNLMLPFL